MQKSEESSDNFPRILRKLGQFHLMKSSVDFRRIPRKLGKLGMCIKVQESSKNFISWVAWKKHMFFNSSLSLVFVVEYPNFTVISKTFKIVKKAKLLAKIFTAS